MFMKITYVTFYFLLCVTSVVAQKNQGQNRIQNLSKLEIGFQGIGYGYETGLGNNLAWQKTLNNSTFFDCKCN